MKSSKESMKLMKSKDFVEFIKVAKDEKAPGGVNSGLLKALRSSALKSATSGVRATIYSKNDPNLERARQLVLGETAFSSIEEDRAFGIMYGMVLGDAIGARLEFEPVDYSAHTLDGVGSGRGGNFSLKPGQWTDDSSMGLCVADSLLATQGNFNGHDCMHRFLAWWFCGYNNAFRLEAGPPRCSCGLGGNISMSLEEYIFSPVEQTVAGDRQTSGNGSVMRNAAVPICFHDDHDTALDVAQAQSFVTHQGLEAAECCRLITHVALLAMKSSGEDRVHKVLSELGDTFKSSVPSVQALANSQMESDNPDRDWRWRTEEGVPYHYCESRARKQPGYIGSYAMDATAMALHCVWSTKSFTEAVLKAVNMRGDADSVGSVTGQIAGAFYGVHEVPKEWIKTVSAWDGYQIALRAYRLYHHIWWDESEVDHEDGESGFDRLWITCRGPIIHFGVPVFLSAIIAWVLFIHLGNRRKAD